MGNSTDLSEEGKKKSGPIDWFIFMILVWIFAYPGYLAARSKYGLKNYLLPGIVSVLIFVVSLSIMASNINQGYGQLQQKLNQFQSQSY